MEMKRKYRSNARTRFQILTFCQDKKIISHLVTHVNCSHYVLIDHLKFLIEKGLVETFEEYDYKTEGQQNAHHKQKPSKMKTFYKTTPRGLREVPRIEYILDLLE